MMYRTKTPFLLWLACNQAAYIIAQKRAKRQGGVSYFYREGVKGGFPMRERDSVEGKGNAVFLGERRGRRSGGFWGKKSPAAKESGRAVSAIDILALKGVLL